MFPQVLLHRRALRAAGSALVLSLGLSLCACGGATDNSAAPSPWTSNEEGGPIIARTGPRNYGTQAAAALEDRDLGELGRASVDVRITEADIRDQYIVRLDDSFSQVQIAQELALQLQYLYQDALHGFAGKLDAAQLERLRRDPRVRDIEPVKLVSIDTTQNMDARGEPWGLDRITQDLLPLNGKYTYDHDGANVFAYVIDTGISITHPELTPRARRSFDALGGDGDDGNGHGTHVSGTIGGTTHGVAKQVQLRGVRVFDATGRGTTAGVIAGVDWVLRNAERPAVVNMSLGGADSAALRDAVDRLAASGIIPIVSAGNSKVDACGVSPANARSAITVGASDRRDSAADFSNFGPCVDLFAPGVEVRSTWPGGGLAILSGTSMAAPHVAGVAALYKQAHGDVASDVLHNWLTGEATPRVLRNLEPGSPDRLLFNPL